MSPSAQAALERAYQRRVLFAVEVLDAVTLAPVVRGLRVVADGLRGKPIVNSRGMFVWLDEDLARLQKVAIDPGDLPYQPAEIPAAALTRPLTTIALAPRVDYPFSAGVTGLRGTLLETRVPLPQRGAPVAGAELWLRWLDDDGTTWHDAPTSARSRPSGDFVAFLRLAPADRPRLDATGAFTVRVHARRGADERRSTDLTLPRGSMADPETFAQGAEALSFAWSELQP